MAGSGDEIKAPSSRPPTFEPLRPATRGWRTVVLLAGPLLWLGSLILVAIVIKHREAVELALLIVAGSLLVAAALLVPMRARRVREEDSA